VVVRLCKVMWIVLQGGCCYKVGAVTRWVVLQGGWCYKVGVMLLHQLSTTTNCRDIIMEHHLNNGENLHTPSYLTVLLRKIKTAHFLTTAFSRYLIFIIQMLTFMLLKSSSIILLRRR